MKKIKVNFFLEASKTNASGLCPIWVRSRHNSTTLIRKSTGLYCDPSQWDKKKKLPKEVNLRNQVNALESDIETKYGELSTANSLVTLDSVWSELRPKTTVKESPKSARIVDWIDHYLAHSPYSPGYTRGVKLLRVHLTGKYTWKGRKMKEVKAFAPGLTFDQLTQTKVDALSKHMADQDKSTSTILKVIKFLKQVAKMARDEGIKVGTLDFKAPKNYVKKTRTEIRLTLDEILRIRDVELKDKNQKIIRDLFLLQCFTGLRHVDLMKLIPENIHDDYIEAKQQKTSDYVYPTLHKYSKPIFNDYLARAKDNHSLLFPQFTQQFYNRTIKDIGEAAGLQDEVRQISYYGPREEITTEKKFDLITSHTGRRSFARMLSQMGLDEQTISEEMGHATRSITRHYVGGLDHKERIREVQKAWEKAELIFKPVMNVA